MHCKPWQYLTYHRLLHDLPDMFLFLQTGWTGYSVVFVLTVVGSGIMLCLRRVRSCLCGELMMKRNISCAGVAWTGPVNLALGQVPMTRGFMGHKPRGMRESRKWPTVSIFCQTASCSFSFYFFCLPACLPACLCVWVCITYSVNFVLISVFLWLSHTHTFSTSHNHFSKNTHIYTPHNTDPDRGILKLQPEG